MLQQTTVVAVKPYFERFLKCFPDVASLAAADEEGVLRLWEGLGYYSRARNLHRTAKVLVEQHAGQLPPTLNELISLPGIGRYTAGAILSFGFDRQAPILEANTLRVYSRLLGFRDDPRSTVGQTLLWSFAEKLVPAKQPGEFNQALTDLGAILCKPNDPDCDTCPVARCCRALAEQSQADIPQPARRPDVTEVREAAIAIESQGCYLLLRRPEGVRWAGLWDFPRFELDGSSASLSKQAQANLEQRIAADFGLAVQINQRLAQLKHSVTRYRITLDCWHAECAAQDVTSDLATAWVSPIKFSQYPLSVTGRKLADLIFDK